MFLRKSGSAREPLPLAMIGVRMGERLLQIGLTDVRLMMMLASKPGISGRSALIVREDRELVRAQSAAARAGVLIEAHVASGAFPFDDESFDVAIAHGTQWPLAECFRVLRAGGRVMIVEPGSREGIASWFRAARTATGGDTIAALQQAGFGSARLLADREGYRFTEGLKR